MYAALIVAVGLLGCCGALLCVLCCACRGAATARKRRKQNIFELETLKAAEREAQHGEAATAERERV